MGFVVEKPQRIPELSGLERPEAQGGVSGRFPVETVDLTQGARLVGRLTQLVKSDPDSFKHVTQEVAARLNEAADNATGQEADRLRMLARTVANAARSSEPRDEPPKPEPVDGRSRAYLEQPVDPAALDAVLKTALAGKL
jgi:hypothetical protein